MVFILFFLPLRSTNERRGDLAAAPPVAHFPRDFDGLRTVRSVTVVALCVFAYAGVTYLPVIALRF